MTSVVLEVDLEREKSTLQYEEQRVQKQEERNQIVERAHRGRGLSFSKRLMERFISESRGETRSCTHNNPSEEPSISKQSQINGFERRVLKTLVSCRSDLPPSWSSRVGA